MVSAFLKASVSPTEAIDASRENCSRRLQPNTCSVEIAIIPGGRTVWVGLWRQVCRAFDGVGQVGRWWAVLSSSAGRASTRILKTDRHPIGHQAGDLSDAEDWGRQRHSNDQLHDFGYGVHMRLLPRLDLPWRLGLDRQQLIRFEMIASF